MEGVSARVQAARVRRLGEVLTGFVFGGGMRSVCMSGKRCAFSPCTLRNLSVFRDIQPLLITNIVNKGLWIASIHGLNFDAF